ncbi:Protein of unknown function [Pseudomonas asplenii]|uniref:DUF3829 domain-containing protein n=1 Tax=Pseudomonas asplenii TaxID=53407 RepID=A0A1H1Z106_9PSED|nr:DUF3829 domain-containing protein [Pseudomonas asplenii]SDT27348.1 Protein of unknown function [Pseudomonas asplenii]
MDQRWFLTFGVLLITAIYMLFGTEQQQSRFGLWLDRHSNEEVAEANALRPLIKCINVMDVPWRLDRTHQAVSQHDDFPYLQRHDPSAILHDFCKTDIGFKAGQVQGTRQITDAVERYTHSLKYMLERYQALQRDTMPEETQALMRNDKQYASTLQTFLADSNALRQELEAADLALRPRQLKQLEQELGRDMHWHLLNYMLQARLTINRLDTAAQNRQLDLPLLGSATDGLRQVRDAAQAYRNALPANRRNGPAHELWSILEPPAQQYQAALEQLATDWRNRAAPQVLSDDYWNVGHRYDVLLALYNRQADVDF